jgi:hypothetical protein
MEDQNQAPESEPEQDADRDRRAALRKLAKAAVYVAPAVIAMLSSTKAMASV